MLGKSLALAGCMVLVFSSGSLAVTATPVTGGTSNTSHWVAGGAVTAAGTSFVAATQARTWWGAAAGVVGGLFLGAGAVTLSLVDPPGGTFHSGTFNVVYPEEFLTPIFSGWLGDWGIDPGASPPPAHPLDWGTGIEFLIQPPAAGLAATIDQSKPGVITVSFDWADGKQQDMAGSFNFFATAFENKKDAIGRYLGEHAAPPPGANFFTANAQIICTPPDDDEPTLCGNRTTSYYQVIPLPPAGALLLTVLTLLSGVRLLRPRATI